jgi:hypothetical protein
MQAVSTDCSQSNQDLAVAGDLWYLRCIGIGAGRSTVARCRLLLLPVQLSTSQHSVPMKDGSKQAAGSCTSAAWSC